MSSIEGVLAGVDRWHVEKCNCMAGLARLPDRCIQTIVTSPPYWALRDYQIEPSIWGGLAECPHVFEQHDLTDPKHRTIDGDPKAKPGAPVSRGQLSFATCRYCGAWRGCFGDEPTVELYIEHTLLILAECHRVLRDDGILWWNLGDSYGHDSKWGGATGGLHREALHGKTWVGRRKQSSGAADLCKLLIPHRVALAAAAAGWIVRQDIVWEKASPMPESVQSTRWVECRRKVGRDPETRKAVYETCSGCDRCIEFPGSDQRPPRRVRLQRGAWRPTTGHEFIFQLAKSANYFCDSNAVKEKAVGDRPGNRVAGKQADVTGDNGKAARMAAGRVNMEAVTHRNPRSVWRVPHEPLREKHFAAYPSYIPRRCILASTSAIGGCPVCHAQFAPVLEKIRVPTRPGVKTKSYSDELLKPGSPYRTHRGDVYGNKDPKRHQTETKLIGWLPTCTCAAAGDPEPAIVLDIFNGTGTTGRVAYSQGRRYIGFEIAERYVELSQTRIVKPFTKRRPVPKHKRPLPDQKSLHFGDDQ
jgi:DNA modification methylase